MNILTIPGNVNNAKSYPFWAEFLALVPEHKVKEIKSILSEKEIIDLINWCDVYITIDSFVPHLVAYHKLNKKGVVIFGKSDPLIFGYPANINLLKDRKNLRPDQFRWWNDQVWCPNDFVSPEEIVKVL